MGLQRLAIPTHESGYTVDLVFLEAWNPRTPPSSSLVHLGRPAIHAPVDAEDEYQQELPSHRHAFAELLRDRLFDLVVSPPSGRSHADPYREEVLRRGIAETDLSDRFHRSPAEAGAGRRWSFDEMIEHLDFEPEADLGRVKSVLIVDDYFVTGRTAAAMMSLMRSRGLSPDARVTVACPLWIRG